MVSILLGSLTHIVWDAFTHPVFWPYQHLSLLRVEIHVTADRTVQIYKLLQHGSTIAGLSVLGILWFRWIRNNGKRTDVFITRDGIKVIA